MSEQTAEEKTAADAKRVALVAKIRARRKGGSVNPPEADKAPVIAKTKVDEETGDVQADPDDLPEGVEEPAAEVVAAPKKKRTRRTKAQIEADKAAAEAPAEEPEAPAEEPEAPAEEPAAQKVTKTVTVPANAPTSAIRLELPPGQDKPILITLTIQIEQKNG